MVLKKKKKKRLLQFKLKNAYLLDGINPTERHPKKPLVISLTLCMPYASIDTRMVSVLDV